ncbi:MFS transporter [Paenibacillus sp. 32352]|uniref:MFS transporter n=1 Tax=Paenibacillus sp. 32352 TaxID=1969111 RepID=UPI0009AD6DE8|nr:MFS transporter [Paenibacillus sp. 32352]
MNHHSLNTRQIHLWRLAIYFIFAIPGFSIASWVSRTPTIRDALGASTAQMGWIIFGLAVGSIVGLLSASHLIAHKGGRFVMVAGLVVSSIGIVVVGMGGSWLASSITVFLGLAVFGFGNGICDVAMNVEGTAVEKAVQKSLLTGFHAAFSVGTLLGALAGSAFLKLGVSVPVHMAVAGVVILLSIAYLYRFVPAGTGKETGTNSMEPPMSARERMAVWKERRTVLIGIIVLGMAFAAAVGIVFWGLGAAFGFPVGLSAAGDDPRGVAARVGAVSTAGYLAFLVGPPFLGLLGESVGLLRALIIVLIAVSVAGLLSQAAKPIGKQTTNSRDRQEKKFESF